jgi:hypothetical protein
VPGSDMVRITSCRDAHHAIPATVHNATMRNAARIRVHARSARSQFFIYLIITTPIIAIYTFSIQ